MYYKYEFVSDNLIESGCLECLRLATAAPLLYISSCVDTETQKRKFTIHESLNRNNKIALIL